jgi:HEAT repeat protein
MNSRALFVTVLAVSALSTGLSAQGRRPKEPTFQDRPLSAWIADLKGMAPYTRNQAAYAIGSMGPAAKAAVPALIEALSDPEPTVRFPACIALKEIGPDAAEAVPALRAALEDRNDDVAAMARKALLRITGEDPTPPGDGD